MSTTESPTVLVADDDDAHAMLTCAALEQSGFITTSVADGNAAFTRATVMQPDAILLDVDMPGMSGFEVCERLRAFNEYGQRVPIVIVTGNEDTASIEHAYDAGATDFIAKPVNWTLLGHRMRYVLRGARDHQALALSEARNRMLIEAFPDRIFIVNGHGMIDYCIGNQALHDDSGLVGQSITTLVPHASSDPREHVAAVLEDGRTRIFEYRNNISGKPTEHLEIRYVAREDGHVMAIARDISERKRAETRIHRLAYFDALTELPNRHHIQDMLRNDIARCRANNVRTAVLNIDLDQFKRINDYLGLATGDEALKAVAARLSTTLKDEVATASRNGQAINLEPGRLGADEFVVVARGIETEGDARRLASRIAAAFNTPVRFDGHEMVLTMCIGISFCPDDGDTPSTLLKNAGAAMKQAKLTGANTINAYSSAINARGRERLHLENELRQALHDGALELYFQPKFNMLDRRLCGAEALLRWLHPVRGFVSPADFIPIAEQTGLISDIDRWVARTTVRQLINWQGSGMHPVPVSINVSAREFCGPDLTRFLARQLSGVRLDAQLLAIEITEGVLMRNATLARETLLALRSLGCALAIDDFGTGFSSLAYLKQFPIDELKIDRSFVMNLESDAENRAICRAVISLAHSLGLKVVAEGVETAAQFDYLAGQKCDVVQGFLLGKPMPCAEFTALLEGDPGDTGLRSATAG